MPVHIDEPAPGMDFEPARFRIRGWLLLDSPGHGELAGVEAWSGDTLLGECDAVAFLERADVNAKYSLPTGTRTAFEFYARHPSVAPGLGFTLELRPRLRDGTRLAPVFTSRLGPLPLEQDPLALLRTRVGANARGLEIGAHTRPVPGLTPYFSDSVGEYVGQAGSVDFLADARALPLPEGVLDYLCSSHVLEHLPDPLAALHEWHRVLRPGGWLYLVVPDKRFSFDALRTVTPVRHLLDDFLHATTAAGSRQHVEEFIYETDWALLRPGCDAADQPRQQAEARAGYLRDLELGRPIDIHFHTFTPESLAAALHAAGFIGGSGPRFDLLARAERYPPERTDGIAFLLRKIGRTAEPADLDTFALAHASPAIAALPLVCPVSLAPLHEHVAPTGERTLRVVDGRSTYSFAGKKPVLLPGASRSPNRPWSHRSWRLPSYATARLRLALSGWKKGSS